MLVRNVHTQLRVYDLHTRSKAHHVHERIPIRDSVCLQLYVSLTDLNVSNTHCQSPPHTHTHTKSHTRTHAHTPHTTHTHTHDLRYGRKQGVTFETQRRAAEELHALELRGAHEENESLALRVQRMLAAWQIPWEHITLNTRLAEGTYGEVWAGLYSNMQVAVKLLKKTAATAINEDPAYASAVARMNAETAEELRK
jgi:hypothetical protein